jgi:hypothetical protein
LAWNFQISSSKGEKLVIALFHHRAKKIVKS